MGLAYVFYTFGILSNGVLIYRLRAFEEMHLSFYRGLAVPRITRFLHYCGLYALLFVPEAVTLLSLYPAHITGRDAISFGLSGYGMLLLMSSLRFTDDFTMKEYLKALFLVFLAGILSFSIIELPLFDALLMLIAVALFYRKYYAFEEKISS